MNRKFEKQLFAALGQLLHAWWNGRRKVTKSGFAPIVRYPRPATLPGGAAMKHDAEVVFHYTPSGTEVVPSEKAQREFDRLIAAATRQRYDVENPRILHGIKRAAGLIA